jgi:YD repeat-containing protein
MSFHELLEDPELAVTPFAQPLDPLLRLDGEDGAEKGRGELTSQTDAKNRPVSFTYDKLGRPLTRTEPEGVTTWTWGQVIPTQSSTASVSPCRT